LNYGKLIFFLRGINFKDLALLTKDNYKNGRIIYRRAKTKKVYSIEVIEPIAEILNRYNDPDRQTLLPILSNEEYVDSVKRQTIIVQRRKTCNTYLKRIGKLVDLDIKLTTYVFRYSWANIARSLGYSKDMIAEGLGHEYGNAVTGIYLNDFDEEKIDTMNKTIINSVI